MLRQCQQPAGAIHPHYAIRARPIGMDCEPGLASFDDFPGRSALEALAGEEVGRRAACNDRGLYDLARAGIGQHMRRHCLRRARRERIGDDPGRRARLAAGRECAPVEERTAVREDAGVARLGVEGLDRVEAAACARDLEGVRLRDDARLFRHADAVFVFVCGVLAVAHMVIVEQVDLAEAHPWRAAGDVFEQVVAEGDAQVAAVADRLVAGADQHVLLVLGEAVIGDGDEVGRVADVERAVVALLVLAVLDCLLVVREGDVGEAVVVDPDMGRADDRDGVELRIPVAFGAILRVPGRGHVAGVAKMEVADDDLRDHGHHDVRVDESGVRAEPDQRGIGGQAHLAARGLVGGAGIGAAFAHVDDALDGDDAAALVIAGKGGAQL